MKSSDALDDLMRLDDNILKLTATWHLLEELCLSQRAQVVLNARFSGTSFELGRSLVEHVLLQLSRIQEGPGRDTLMGVRNRLEREFPRAALERDYVADRDAIRGELDPLRERLREHRGAWVVHLDRAYATGASMLTPFLVADMRKAIEMIERLGYLFNRTFRNVGFSYRWKYSDDPSAIVRSLGRDQAAEKPGAAKREVEIANNLLGLTHRLPGKDDADRNAAIGEIEDMAVELLALNGKKPDMAQRMVLNLHRQGREGTERTVG
jgi:hypothetical protein